MKLSLTRQSRFSQPKSIRHSAGFTLLELLVALTLLAAATYAGVVFYQNQDRATSQAAYALVGEYANALQRARLDAPCYPTQLKALSDPTAAAGTTGSVCAQDISAMLDPKGYVLSKAFDASGNLQTGRFGSGSVLRLRTAGTVPAPLYYLDLTNVTTAFATQFLAQCNGSATGVTPCSSTTASGVTYVSMLLP